MPIERILEAEMRVEPKAEEVRDPSAKFDLRDGTNDCYIFDLSRNLS